MKKSLQHSLSWFRLLIFFLVRIAINIAICILLSHNQHAFLQHFKPIHEFTHVFLELGELGDPAATLCLLGSGAH